MPKKSDRIHVSVGFSVSVSLSLGEDIRRWRGFLLSPSLEFFKRYNPLSLARAYSLSLSLDVRIQLILSSFSSSLRSLHQQRITALRDKRVGKSRIRRETEMVWTGKTTRFGFLSFSFQKKRKALLSLSKRREITRDNVSLLLFLSLSLALSFL